MHKSIFIIISLLFTSNLNEWESISSTLSPNKIIKYNDYILSATSGGLLNYNLITNAFNQYNVNNDYEWDIPSLTIPNILAGSYDGQVITTTGTIIDYFG